MHIPDGYLGPQTYVPACAAMVPIWWRASEKLKKTLRMRQIPMLALGSAFSFIIMMFNVPVPGGTSGHAVGAVLVAILLGPWAAVVAVSMAVVVQALLFGDGGVTAIGANCINMAVLMPFVGWSVYRLIARGAASNSRRQWIGGAVGGYVGLNAAALGTAVMLGIQPIIAHDTAGHALYCPFGLKTALIALCGSHLLVLGFVEAVVTGYVIEYLQVVEPSLLPGETVRSFARTGLKPAARVAALVGAMILLCPLGLYIPAKFASGSAWGEWSGSEIHRIAGYVPAGFEKLDGVWRAPMPDYAPIGKTSSSMPTMSVYYILSGVVGAGLLVTATYGLRGVLWRRSGDIDPGVDAPSDNA